jgi:hypothetical protein
MTSSDVAHGPRSPDRRERPDVLVAVEDVLRVPFGLEPRQPLVAVGCEPSLYPLVPLVSKEVEVGRAGRIRGEVLAVRAAERDHALVLGGIVSDDKRMNDERGLAPCQW